MPGDVTPKQMLTAMRHIEPSKDVRTAWQYSNLGYNAASIVVERTSGLAGETDRDGNLASLSAQLEPMVADIVFKRAPAGECLDDAFRKACVGTSAPIRGPPSTSPSWRVSA